MGIHDFWIYVGMAVWGLFVALVHVYLRRRNIELPDKDGYFDLFDEEQDRPTVNVDGTPMVGDVDIHGHAYGVTDLDPPH